MSDKTNMINVSLCLDALKQAHVIPCNTCTGQHYGCLVCLRNMWKMDQLENSPQLLLDDLETKCPHCTGYVNVFQTRPAPTIDQLTRDIVFRCKNNECD